MYNNPYSGYGYGNTNNMQNIDDSIKRMQDQLNQTISYRNQINNQQQPQQQFQQQPTSNVNWIKVNGIEDIKNINVNDNESRWIMVTSLPIFAIKSANNLGQTTTEMYQFSKYVPQETQDKEVAQVEPQQIDLSEYVKKQEVQPLLDELESLKKELEELKKTKATNSTISTIKKGGVVNDSK
jgi:hypothetical protein